jgi:hypothetical protein
MELKKNYEANQITVFQYRKTLKYKKNIIWEGCSDQLRAGFHFTPGVLEI